MQIGIGLALTMGGGVRSIAVPSGIIAYWPLDDATISGNTVRDAGATGYNGAKTGTSKPSSTTGEIKQGLLFDGSTGWVDIQGLSINVFPFAISLWFKTSDTSAAFRTIAGAGNSANVSEDYNLGLTTTHTVQWQPKGTNVAVTVAGSVAMNDGAWHHALGVSRSGNDHELYIDGASAATSASVVSAPQTNQASIGALSRSSVGSFYPGSIDDVRFYNRAITTAEALAIYTAGLAGRP